MADSVEINAEEVTGAFVRERALAMVTSNLAPSSFLLLPSTLLVSSLLRGDATTARLGWWIIASVIATTVSLIALYRYFMRGDVRSTPRVTQLLIGLSFCSIGVLLGMAPWVAGDTSVELVLLLTLFPSTGSAVGCIVTAGRRDMYLAFLLPLIATAAWPMLDSSHARLRGVGGLAVLFGLGLILLHHIVSRNTLEAIRLQWRSERLLRDLAHERSELTGVNEQLATTNKRLAHQATHDPLTGLYNRRGTLDLLDQVLTSSPGPKPVGLLFCDLDSFKAVNDSLGHRGGDRFISIIADRLSRSLERGAIAGRIGGDEFVVVVPDADLGATAVIADRLVTVLAQPVYAEGREVPSSVSIGVAATRHCGQRVAPPRQRRAVPGQGRWPESGRALQRVDAAGAGQPPRG